MPPTEYERMLEMSDAELDAYTRQRSENVPLGVDILHREIQRRANDRLSAEIRRLTYVSVGVAILSLLCSIVQLVASRR